MGLFTVTLTPLPDARLMNMKTVSTYRMQQSHLNAGEVKHVCTAHVVSGSLARVWGVPSSRLALAVDHSSGSCLGSGS